MSIGNTLAHALRRSGKSRSRSPQPIRAAAARAVAEMLEQRQLLSVTAAQMTTPSSPIEGQQIEVDLLASTTSGQGTSWAVVVNGDTQNPIYAYAAEGVSTPIELPGQSTGTTTVDAHVTDAGDSDDMGTDVSTLYLSVAEAAISFQPANSFSVNQGDDFTADLGTITDQNPQASADDFTVQYLTWWDGQNGGTPTITYDAADSTDTQSVFDVQQDHSFTEAGSDGFSFSVQDTEGESAYGMTEIDVTPSPPPPPPPIYATGTSDTMYANPGTEFSATLADFTDTNPSGQQSDYSATIDWGDGSGTDTGASIVSDGSGGWWVQGSHYYSTTGVYTASVTINDVDGASANATSSVDVNYQPGVVNATMSVPNASTDGQDVQATLYATTTTGSGTDWDVDFNGCDTQTYVPEAQYTSFDLGTLSQGSYQIQAHVMDASGSTDPSSPLYDPGVDLGPDSFQVYSGDFSFSTTPVTVANNNSPDWITVGTVTDQNPYATGGEFTLEDQSTGATIPAQFVLDASQSNGSQSVFDVQMQLSYGKAGNEQFCTILQDDLGRSAYNTIYVTVDGPALNLDTSAVACVAVGSAEDPTVVVGQVTDANSDVDASDLSGLVNWGDGSSSSVSFVPVAGSPGVFDVTATLPTDTSTAATTPYSMSVTDNDTGVSAGDGYSNNGDGYSNNSDGGAGSGYGSASVGGPLTPSSPAPGPLVEGQGSGQISLDQLTAPEGTYVTAKVDYGDGTTPQPADVSEVSDGTFDVIGAHDYEHEGDYNVTVTVTESFCTIPPSQSEYSNNQTLHVDAAPFTIDAQNPLPVVGQGFTDAIIGVLTDEDQYARVGDFSATVTWGDGSSGSAVLEAVAGAPGVFNILASHTYANFGDFDMNISVQDTGGTSGSGSVTLNLPAPTVSVGTVTAGVGQTLEVPVSLAGEDIANQPLSIQSFDSSVISAQWDGSNVTDGNGNAELLVTGVNFGATNLVIALAHFLNVEGQGQQQVKDNYMTISPDPIYLCMDAPKTVIATVYYPNGDIVPNRLLESDDISEDFSVARSQIQPGPGQTEFTVTPEQISGGEGDAFTVTDPNDPSATISVPLYIVAPTITLSPATGLLQFLTLPNGGIIALSTPIVATLTDPTNNNAPIPGVTIALVIPNGPIMAANNLVATDINGQATFSVKATNGVFVNEVFSLSAFETNGTTSNTVSLLAYWRNAPQV